VPRRRRFEYIRHGPGFPELLLSAPADIRKALAETLGPLLENPLPRQSLLGVRELRGEPRIQHTYTVPFAEGDGLLVFEVMQDMPVIKLINMTWIDR
jgi:hypothetical protein